MTLTPNQRDRIVYDAQRALLRAFGCHYVPEYEALPESARAEKTPPPPAARNRPELDELQTLVREALTAALAPHVGY